MRELSHTLSLSRDALRGPSEGKQRDGKHASAALQSTRDVMPWHLHHQHDKDREGVDVISGKHPRRRQHAGAGIKAACYQ